MFTGLSSLKNNFLIFVCVEEEIAQNRPGYGKKDLRKCESIAFP